MASTLVFMAIFVIDFIAFVLALAAEHMRSTAKAATDSDSIYSYCVYSSDIATKLGAIAFVLLLASQVFSMGASSYFRKGMNYGGSRTSAVIPSIISWITFFIAEACLLGGAIKNAQHTKYRTISGTDGLHCQTLSAGVFEAGAAFILITSIVSIEQASCVYCGRKNTGSQPNILMLLKNLKGKEVNGKFSKAGSPIGFSIETSPVSHGPRPSNQSPSHGFTVTEPLPSSQPEWAIIVGNKQPS